MEDTALAPLLTGGATGAVVVLLGLVIRLALGLRQARATEVASGRRAPSQHWADYEAENAILLAQMASVHSENERLAARVRALEEDVDRKENLVRKLQAEIGDMQRALALMKVELATLTVNDLKEN